VSAAPPPGQQPAGSGLIPRLRGFLGAGRLRRSEVLRSSAVAAVIRVLGMGVVFLLQILLARLAVDATTYGAYAWGQNLLFLLGNLFALGVPVIASRQVSVFLARGERERQREVSREAHRWVGGTSLLLSALGLLLVWQLPERLFHSLSREVVCLALLTAPLVSLTMLRQALARAGSRLLSAFLPTQVLRPLLTGLLALAAFLWLQRSLEAVDILVALWLSLAVVLLVQLLTPPGHPQAPIEGAATAERRELPRGLLRQSLPVFATRLADLAMTYGNTLILGVLGGPLAAGSFFVAERLAQISSVPGSVTSAVIQPWLASAYADDQRDRLQQVITQATHVGIWPGIAVGLLLIWAGHFLLGLFGADFGQAYPVLVMLVVAHVSGSVLGPCQQLLSMSGRQQLVMRVVMGGAVVHLLALLLLIPTLGALGAAVASWCSTTLIAVACWVLVRRRLQLHSGLLSPRSWHHP